jgi:hypothetical protein
MTQLKQQLLETADPAERLLKGTMWLKKIIIQLSGSGKGQSSGSSSPA